MQFQKSKTLQERLVTNNVGKQVVGKANDVVTTVYTDAKGLASKPFEFLSNPFTMIAVGIAK